MFKKFIHKSTIKAIQIDAGKVREIRDIMLKETQYFFMEAIAIEKLDQRIKFNIDSSFFTGTAFEGDYIVNTFGVLSICEKELFEEEFKEVHN